MLTVRVCKSSSIRGGADMFKRSMCLGCWRSIYDSIILQLSIILSSGYNIEFWIYGLENFEIKNGQ